MTLVATMGSVSRHPSLVVRGKEKISRKIYIKLSCAWCSWQFSINNDAAV